MRIVLLFLGVWMILAGTAIANWTDLDSKEHLILFQPPYTGVARPEISVKEYRTRSARAEWMCWREFNDKAANACITYQTSQRGFDGRVYSPGDVIRYYNAFDDITALREKESHDLDHPLSDAAYVRFKFKNGSWGFKNCIAFALQPRVKKKEIHGWYCAPSERQLATDAIELMISTIGIKGEYEPGPIDYPPLEK